MTKLPCLFLTVLLFICGCGAPKARVQPETFPAKENAAKFLNAPYVILVSIDGYRFDYTHIYQPPHLLALQEAGASAQALIPSFPSKTYPNHYSIVTGLYPENHGIVANYFYDQTRPHGDTLYKLSNRQAVRDGSWYSGEPIWNVAEKNGMLAANYFWPVGETSIHGLRSTYTLTYDEKIPNEARVQKVLEWLRLPAAVRPHFICLYFSDVDTAGHAFGPRSPEVKAAVLKVDDALGQLKAGIDGLALPINLVVVSDHGMQDVNKKEVEYIDDYTDLNDVVIGDLGPQILIYDHGLSLARLGKIYSDLKAKGKHFKIFRREDFPKRLHYSKNFRAGSLIVVAQAPYSIGIHDVRFKVEKGNHGFDPLEVKNMHGIFYASGPQIKAGRRLRSFSNVNIYPFVLSLLGLPFKQNIDGRAEVLGSLLKNPE